MCRLRKTLRYLLHFAGAGCKPMSRLFEFLHEHLMCSAPVQLAGLPVPLQ